MPVRPSRAWSWCSSNHFVRTALVRHVLSKKTPLPTDVNHHEHDPLADLTGWGSFFARTGSRTRYALWVPLIGYSTRTGRSGASSSLVRMAIVDGQPVRYRSAPDTAPDPSPDAALKQVDGLHDVPRPHLAGLRRRARRVSSMIRSELRRSARGSDVRETSSDRVRASISLYIGYIVEPPFKEDLEDSRGGGQLRVSPIRSRV